MRFLTFEWSTVATVFTGPVLLWLWTERALLHGQGPGIAVFTK
ncbi:hypothetical protein DFR70_101780 [Nocardia tenerifensis]|uniref:Uncharacterized protein n=1 Tax=Nocardia tenerifensis TaxID=228006 RepID=A0A318KAJ8_9NOCA|nr:hypothetical protein DFR70_101780 [Nocardia tenerifensis]